MTPWKLAVLAALLVGGCDPVWTVHARIRTPDARPVDRAIVTFGCPAGVLDGAEGLARETDGTGAAHVQGMGIYMPACDLFVLKPGYRTEQIPFTQICPRGREHCDRTYRFDLVLKPE